MSAIDRVECLTLVREAQTSGASAALACELLGVAKRTVERWAITPADGRRGPISKPANAFTPEERARVLEVSNSPLYANLPPGQIVPTLADLGSYIGSESTFYRIFKAKNLLAHRSKSQPRRHVKPEALMAMSPNQIWSWDITYCTPSRSGTAGCRKERTNMNGMRVQTKGVYMHSTALCYERV